jgi:hypothetical protein
MATAPNTNINIPYSPFLNTATGRPNQEWLLWLMNPQVLTINISSALGVTSGGTGLTTIPTNGQLLIGNGTGYTLNTLGYGAGISVVNGSGTITLSNTGVLSNIAGTGIAVSGATGNVTISNTGVLSWSGGSTGLTPATATTGAVTLGGTLAIASGGTNGSATPTAGAVAYGTGTAYGFTLAGTTNQALLSTGAGTPAWATLTTGSSILYGNGSGLFSNVTIGSGVSFAGGVLSATGTGGTVTAVTATTPLASSGGTTPNLTIQQSSASQAGYLSAADWTTFNSKQPAGTYVTSVSGTTGQITSTGGTTPVIDLASGVATPGTTGSSTLIPVVTIDTYGRVTSITTASNPQGTVTSVAALTLGTTGTDLSSTVANSTTTPVITLNVPTASATNRGALSAADWTTFNNKQPAGTYVTSVTGTAPVVSSGGTTPAISMAAANGTTNGYLTSTDWTTFNNKGSGSVTSVSFTGGIISVGTPTTTPALTVAGTSGGIPYFSSGTTWASSAALTQYGVIYGGGAGASPVATAAGTTGQVLTGVTGSAPVWAAPATSGTVTSVSVVSANGFAGTVATATTTPAITLTTTITGLLKGNGTAISAAVSGTDYAPATSGSAILYGNGSGGFSSVTIGSGVTFSAGTLSATGSGGTVTSVAALTLGTTGTDLTSTVANGSTTPVITLNVPTASATNRGALSSTDWSTFNSKQSVSAPVTKTADFTVAATDLWLINNKSGSTCTVTLPTASSYSGRVLHFQNYQAQTVVSASSNVVPLTGGAAGTSILLASSGDQTTLVSDGTNWLITQYTPNNILLLE